VYRARDPRLGRDVAIKVLPPALSADADRLRRFEHEARAAAALNHPNILAVFDLGLETGSPFIVMELLEGDTLRERLTGGALPVRKTVDVAAQIARGLAAAHDKGIVHRDLKPENVFVMMDGRVKILDFGLAKLTEAAGAGSASGSPASMLSQAPTLSPPTTPGMVLGTVGYMAPEQVRGEVADHRADIFALGCMLYEMVTGRRAFHATSAVETMTAILTEDPTDLSDDGVPTGLARITARCLEKLVGARFQTATDLAFALEALSSASTVAVAGSAASPRRRGTTQTRTITLAAVAALLAAAVTAWLRMPTPAPANLVTRFELAVGPSESAVSLAVSPDGQTVAYVATTEKRSSLWVRRLDSTTARTLPGTEGATFPFWAPDSSALGFFADGKLKRLDLADGAPRALADAPVGRGGTWGPEGVILYTPGNFALAANSVITRVFATGGTPTPVTHLAEGEGSHRWPQFLPDGRRFIYFNTLGIPATQGIYIGSLDGAQPRFVLASDTPAIFVAPNRLLICARRHADGSTVRPRRGGRGGRAAPRGAADWQGFWRPRKRVFGIAARAGLPNGSRNTETAACVGRSYGQDPRTNRRTRRKQSRQSGA